MVKRFYSGSGRYNVRVVIQEDQSDQFPDEYGNTEPRYEDKYERWAEVVPGKGREFMANNQVQAEQDHTVRMRYDRDTATIDTDNRLRIKRTGRILDIVAAMNSHSRNEMMVFAVKELVKERG